METQTVSISAIIDEMVERIVREFNPLKIILFGSQARGDTHKWSDVDLLVVMPDDADKRATMNGILRTLRDMPIAKDIVLTTPDEIARRGDLIGTVLRPALREGKIVYDRQ